MFRIESYVTPILLSYVDKYVRDFKPADAQVSLWGGGVALHNLVLKADVLQQEVSLPFTLISGRIHELLIQVPWTKIMSEPIVITIDTIECVLSLRQQQNDEWTPPQTSAKTQVVEAPPGYMQALVRRIVSNISLRIHHLIVKYVEDDIVLSLNVKHLAIDSADANWNPAFADIDQVLPVLRRLVQLDDLTLCLDRADSDGKIRFYQEPVLYRCQLTLRVLTKLVSANTRRATSLNVQLRSSKLAWGLTTDQLTLLLRLLRERSPEIRKQSSPPPKSPSATNALNTTPSRTSNTAEPVRNESWSEWAWSWLPTYSDRDTGIEEAPLPPAPVPMNFTACFDSVCLVFKIMEIEPNGRKKTRGVLEFCTDYTAIKGSICTPTNRTFSLGVRNLKLKSRGKCVCGHLDINAASEEHTMYLSKLNAKETEDEWDWPPEAFEDNLPEPVLAVVEEIPDKKIEAQSGPSQNANESTPKGENESKSESIQYPHELWAKMVPTMFIHFTHERSPPDPLINPYENPPVDFEFTDWVESCVLKVHLQPLDVRVCMGLIHRLAAIKKVFDEIPPTPEQESNLRTLTVEECDALLDNLPQRRINLTWEGIRLRLIQWDHSLQERPLPTQIALHLNMMKGSVQTTGPLYSERVCSAACQMPHDSGPLWNGARFHVTASLNFEASLVPLENKEARARPVARADLRFVSHRLLHSHLFNGRESINFSYVFKIKEANICGSTPRLQAALQIVNSLIEDRGSMLFRHTTLINDAVHDEESVAIDCSVENVSLKGYVTNLINTHILVLQTARATVIRKTQAQELKQAWLFSAPDSTTSTAFIRVAVQWCKEPMTNSLDYIGVWTEPVAICIDPLFIAWLAYKPLLRPAPEPPPSSQNRKISSSQYLMRRKATPPSSSGKGPSRSGSGTELIHSSRPRSHASSSEPSERKEKTPPAAPNPAYSWRDGDNLKELHSRLRHLLFNVEFSNMVLYVTLETASAVDSETVRDAMEHHASTGKKVLALSLARLTIHCSAIMKYLWQEIRPDGPTFISAKLPDNEDSFPWKMKIGELCCYALEAAVTPESEPRTSSGLRSQLKSPRVVNTVTIVEPITTSITLSVVTKSLSMPTYHRKHTSGHKEQKLSPAEERVKYFKLGHDFKPTTLQDFVRGPASRKKKETEPENVPKEPVNETENAAAGPLVSFGVHIHADTPPIMIRLNHNQVHLVAATVHCFEHIIALIHQEYFVVSKNAYTSPSVGSQRSLIRSVSENEEKDSDERLSEKSELISIFESHTVNAELTQLKTFIWFQWVMGRVSLVATTDNVKLAFNVDDIISTIDLQSHYNQFKIKVASASVKHFERIGMADWTAATLGGRVLEAREPTNAKDDNHFLSITVTQAQISTLPRSWKEELHPKILQSKSGVDTMWEIYATLAPLEAVLMPTVLEHIMYLLVEFAPKSYCPLPTTTVKKPGEWQWPYCYLSAGGLRLLVNSEGTRESKDDTFLFEIGKMEINPHPENPICRRTANVGAEGTWLSVGSGFEGRQYEVFVRNISLKSAQFAQIASHEFNGSPTGGENPAVKWAQPPVSPVLTPILHELELNCVYAPALYYGNVLVCGPAFDLNMTSDCNVEVSLDQLWLFKEVLTDLSNAAKSNSGDSSTLFLEETGVCPYAEAIMRRTSVVDEGDNTSLLYQEMDTSKILLSSNKNAADSGLDSNSASNLTSNLPKKNMSVAFFEDVSESVETMEVFITMGVIELSLYTIDDDSVEVNMLKPPSSFCPTTLPRVPTSQNIKDPVQSIIANDESISNKSLTDTVRTADIGKTKLRVGELAHKAEGMVPLLHATLQQPNLYYWKKKNQRNVQISLFNLWIGLGAEQSDAYWHTTLLNTAKGVPDSITDIPPALATLKLATFNASNSYNSLNTPVTPRGSLRIDVERPVQLEVSFDNLQRLQRILNMVNENIKRPVAVRAEIADPPFYNLRQTLVTHAIESITIQTTQVGLCGSQGTVGWANASVQVAIGMRPERLVTRTLINAFLVTIGSQHEMRHPLLHPMVIGSELEVTWEAWRRAEGGISEKEPTIRHALELDRIVIDFRPEDLVEIRQMKENIDKLIKLDPALQRKGPETSKFANPEFSDLDSNVHYYKDDLRSGAFKIVHDNQLPMAYQVTLNGSAVSWKYPHPRAITRVVVYPLPNQDTEVECVLEHFSRLLLRWEPHIYFSLPVSEPREINLFATPPDAVFATMWRCRTCSPSEEQKSPYEFSFQKFAPRTESLVSDPQIDNECPKTASDVTAEQLSGVIRVDSYFAPKLLPRLRTALRISEVTVYLHNSLPDLSRQVTALEGYYVSKPLMKSHRVISFVVRDTTAHVLLSSSGVSLLLNTFLLSEMLDCTTGTMDPFIEQTRVQIAVSVPNEMWDSARSCFRTAPLNVSLNIPKLRTLQVLASDWKSSLSQNSEDTSSMDLSKSEKHERNKAKREIADEAANALEGRIAIWLHNSCALALRVGQEGTDEVIPLGPGARLAYRWRCPSSPKKLRFAITSPSTDWTWSNSISLSEGRWRVRLQGAESLGGGEGTSSGVFLYIHIEETAARRNLHIAGRVAFANMLRHHLNYKVRARTKDASSWRTVCSDELLVETVGRTVVCGADCEMTLKIKFSQQEAGWSGDIPLKECPKENVPWLVKVPSKGDMPYVSVWCRVIRARSDGRILATIWPLYVLHSHLPLDTDVLITTETRLSSMNLAEETSSPPLVQTALGRGTSTHVYTPGTTAARHNLTFQYRNIDCPVTREAVPLHYGVTDTSVFDKRAAINNIDEVIADIITWLQRSGTNAESDWPYSMAAKHWPEPFQAALLQPRCDVTVRYQAVNAGGGCCLELQLCPVVLLCNATTMALTLRAHDAAPLCKLESGTAISPSSALINKPFFMSIEVGRETFVSGQLEVWHSQPGRYGAPPSGCVAIDHPAPFAIQCNQKVALMTLYYEVKHFINVVGVSCTYMLINRLNTEVLVSPVAMPTEFVQQTVYRPKSYVMASPTPEGSIHGTPLCRFTVHGRWHGNDVSELQPYMFIALPAGAYAAAPPVPIRLGATPVRRAIALLNCKQRSVAVVVSQVKHEGRWLITVSPDPCPQYVLHNNTNSVIAVGQPSAIPDQPSTSRTTCVSDCEGVQWNCELDPGVALHYSTPAHCNRYPPIPTCVRSNADSLSFLTFAYVDEENYLYWCSPVAIVGGEQMLQVSRGPTLKLRIHPHHHSTLIELLDVAHNDISASDIRRRLYGAFTQIYTPEQSLTNLNQSTLSRADLERVGAKSKLLVPSNLETQSKSKSEVRIATPEVKKETSDSSTSIESLKGKDVSFKVQDENQTIKVEVIPTTSVPDELVVIDKTDSHDFRNQQSMKEWEASADWSSYEVFRGVFSSFVLRLSAGPDVEPLIAIFADRVACRLNADLKSTRTTLSIADFQIDNQQYETGQFDFPVIATTHPDGTAQEEWPPLWNMFDGNNHFSTREDTAHVLVKTKHDRWNIYGEVFNELAEIEARVGPLALYVEDAYVTALANLLRSAFPVQDLDEAAFVLNEARAFDRPLRLRNLLLHPVDLTLTLHTAVRMYIALDQSPLHLSAFKLHDMMTSTEQLTHALTVHYLSAALLGAGWVVGGLELLGAPGAVAARVGGARGGLRGVAAAAAAALLHSLSACAGSLARNLDILTGDEEHARRAAAARRIPPETLLAGLAAGLTNFGINILSAVGGLAHHPLVGVVMGETGGAGALRRGLLGAVAKPLSATADLVAYAGHGLLRQTGWDAAPQPRPVDSSSEVESGWRRDCVRWSFRLNELYALDGFRVLLDHAPLHLLLTHKFLVIADPETEKVVEMIDFKFCTLAPYQGQIIELSITQRRQSKSEPKAMDEDDEYQMTAAAMARVARYTGATGSVGSSMNAGSTRVLSLLPGPGLSHCLHAALTALLQHNSDTHHRFM